nr:glycosyltransferase family 4 protein [Alteromonas ponticola]
MNVFSKTHPLSEPQAIKRFIIRNNIDLVLAEYGSTGVHVMDACAAAEVPFIVHFHGWDAYTDYMLETFGDAYQVMFKRAAKVVAVSRHMKSQLVAIGCPENKIAVIPCGADLPAELAKSTYQPVKKFIMVGRLTPKKGPLNSLKAFKEVVSSFPHVKLDIIGDGQLKQEIESFIAEHALEDNVTLLGPLDHDKVVKHLLDSDCFLQHSVVSENNDHEGTPVGVLEAMMIGLPVIATRHGGISDVMTHEESGILINEHDIESMQHYMKLLVSDPAMAESIGRKGRDTALERHTAAISIANLKTTIEHV